MNLSPYAYVRVWYVINGLYPRPGLVYESSSLLLSPLDTSPNSLPLFTSCDYVETVRVETPRQT